ncbi:hypothetical protein SESBI_34142 [Sesbania bispinosa]|nr:hypothetical protein SESBI_34142 [Sesbania bispinosa]
MEEQPAVDEEGLKDLLKFDPTGHGRQPTNRKKRSFHLKKGLTSLHHEKQNKYPPLGDCFGWQEPGPNNKAF